MSPFPIIHVAIIGQVGVCARTGKAENLKLQTLIMHTTMISILKNTRFSGKGRQFL